MQPPHWADAGEPGPAVVWVNTEHRFQTIEGFGGAFTEAAAVTWLALDAAQARGTARCLLRPGTRGHGYSLCRVHMGSCDFALGNYAHVETPGDMALASFSIERDRQALLPFIQAAQRVAGRPIKLLASPWSPPAWMKTNGQMNDGGKLRADCRAPGRTATCASSRPTRPRACRSGACRCRTSRWPRSAGTPASTPPRRSATSCATTSGPRSRRPASGNVKIVIWDHNRDLMVERASAVYADPEAARYVWGTGFHWYGEDHFDHVQQVHDAWPDKQLLFTEGCQEGGPHTARGNWASAMRAR